MTVSAWVADESAWGVVAPMVNWAAQHVRDVDPVTGGPGIWLPELDRVDAALRAAHEGGSAAGVWAVLGVPHPGPPPCVS